MNNAKKRGKQFTKAYQPPAANKRVKKRKTILKEKLGLQSWEALGEYITKHGVNKLVKELKKMDGKNYVVSHLQAAEYFKPKLSRTEHAGEINFNKVDLSKFTDEELKTWIALNDKAAS